MTTSSISASTLRLRRPAGGLAAALVSVGLAGALLPASAAAGTLSITENISLKLDKKVDSKLTHRGTATGTIPGNARASSTLRGLRLRGTVTVVTKRGSLRIKIDGRARTSGTRPRFEGTASLAGGTGTYRRARGTGRFDGIVDRSTWAATIRASGTFSY